MSTNFAKEFKLYESLFSERKHKLTENTTNNKCFYMVLLRTSESYSIEALANDEATARNAYNDTLAGIKPVIEEEDALMLVEVFNLAAFKKLKPFAGKGFTEDEHIDNLLDNILDSYSNTLEYYEPGGDEDEQAGNNANIQAGNNANINEYRVVLADYDTDDFDINVEFGLQDPDENEVVDYEYLLEPGQTRGDLVVYLSRDCGFTSIYVHDERPANATDIKRLAQDTFPVTGTGDDWEDYGYIDERLFSNETKHRAALKESVDYLARLKANEIAGTPWYTEYFAVGPSVCNKTTNEVLTPEDFDDYWEDFEAAMNDSKKYTIMPIVFGPSGSRAYTKEAFDTLEDALDNVLEFSYADEVSSYGDLPSYMINAAIPDNSVTFLTATDSDNQDSYGCFMRVSQKPLNSNRQLGKYFASRRSKSGPNMLADMLDGGLLTDPISAYPNYDKDRYAWQAK